MIRVFPRRTKWTPTDELAFVGDPPLIRPFKQPVKISVCFTWDIAEGWRLYREWQDYYSDVEIGGPAFDDIGHDFIPGRFIKPGVTITSRGCHRKCSWFYVPEREGIIRGLPIMPGWIIRDNNLLACSHPHIESVFDMLRIQKKSAIFAGGIDARLLKPWHCDLFDSIKIKELWFACDSIHMVYALEKAVSLLNYPRRKMRCYVMIGFGYELIEDAERRLELVYSLGFDPFCQLYRGEDEQEYTQDWKDLSRKWSRPAAYHSRKGS